MASTKPIRIRLAMIIFLAQSFFSASTIAAFTLSPIIAVYLSGNESAAGIPNTLTLIGRAAFAFPFGYLMDRFGRRFALSSGYGIAFFGGIISAVAVIANSYILFLIGAFLIGMARSSGDQSRFVAAEIFPSQARATIIGFIVFAGTIGSVLGPTLVPRSRRLIEQFGVPADSGPFVAATVLLFLSTLVVVLFLRPDPIKLSQQIAKEEASSNPDSVESNTTARPWQEVFAQPLVQLAVLSMTIGYFVMVFVMVITPVHMNHGLAAHMNDDAMAVSVSGVIMWHTLGMFGVSIFSGYLIDLFGRLNMILIGAIILAIACVVSPFSLSIPVLSLGLFLLGLGWNFTFVAGSSLLSNALAVSERGQIQGLAETIVSVASGVASLTVGLVFQTAGYELVNIIGFVFSAILIAAVFYLPRQATKAGIPQPTA